MSRDERVAYAVAYCLQNNCEINGLPGGLAIFIRSHPAEMQMILDGIGKKTEKIEVINGKEFKLPLTPNGISWNSMSPDDRVAYAIAFCNHHKCWFTRLPGGLPKIIHSNPKELKRVLDGIERATEKVEHLDGKEFRLPLNSHRNTSWSSMSSGERVAYAIAYCKHHKCGIHGIPKPLSSIFHSHPEEMKQLLEGLERKTEKIEVVNEITFTLLLNHEGNISWKSMSPDEKLSYAIAFCKEHNCGIGKLPHGLYVNLTPVQRSKVIQELGKSSESDQLDKLADAMVKF